MKIIEIIVSLSLITILISSLVSFMFVIEKNKNENTINLLANIEINNIDQIFNNSKDDFLDKIKDEYKIIKIDKDNYYFIVDYKNIKIKYFLTFAMEEFDKYFLHLLKVTATDEKDRKINILEGDGYIKTKYIFK